MSSGGGGQTTTEEKKPYAPAEPYLKDVLAEAGKVYRSGTGRSYFPGSTVVPYAQQTEEALKLQQAAGLEQAGPSSMYGQASGVFGAYAGQPISAYGALTPQADYLSGVRQGIVSDVMGDVATQFGGMGRTGTSPMAQQAAARGITQAYAPIAAEQASLERGRELTALESGIGRQLESAGQLPQLQNMMDVRRLGGIQQLGQVGRAYEDRASKQLADQMARYEFEQRAPMEALRDYAGLITPVAFQYPSQVSTAPGPNRFTSAAGGAQTGAAIGGMFGQPGIGAGLGALGGLLF